jgi:hypothetical protein
MNILSSRAALSAIVTMAQSTSPAHAGLFSWLGSMATYPIPYGMMRISPIGHWPGKSPIMADAG